MVKKKAAKKNATTRATATKKAASKKKVPAKKKVAQQPLPPAMAAIKRKYRKNFLKQVIARMDFALPAPLLENEPPKAVVAALKKQFPIAEPKKQVTQHMFFTAGEVHRSQQESVQWYYHSKKRDKTLCITPEFMLIEYKKYRAFESLHADFVAVANALFDAIDNLQVKRLGLRYIDNIEFPREKKPTDWKKYLHPDLLACFNLADDQGTISRAFHVLEFNYGDMNMRFQYGMPNPDFPAAIKKKLFTLDYDAHCTQLLGRDNIPEYLTRFHGKIKASFEEVIADGLRDVMGVTHAK